METAAIIIATKSRRPANNEKEPRTNAVLRRGAAPTAALLRLARFGVRSDTRDTGKRLLILEISNSWDKSHSPDDAMRPDLTQNGVGGSVPPFACKARASNTLA
jgi:hypothetical protein